MEREAPILIFLTVVVGLGMLAAGPDSTGTGSKPDFTGKWELNVGQSKFGKMSPPTRMTLEATRKGEVFHAVQTSYDQTGGPNAVEGNWYLDAKQHPLGSDGKMVSVSKWDGNVLVNERMSKDKSYDEVVRLTLSGDGKTATEEIKTKDPNGSDKRTLVWNRR